MLWQLRKWQQTVSIGISNYLAYKLNFLFLIIGPTLVFFFIKYNLWSAIYDMDGVETIQGYDFKTMLSYQVWVMIVGFLAQSYNSMNLAEDIRYGRISSYLIYPFSFWSYHTARFIGVQIIQLFISALTLISVISFGAISLPSLKAFISGFVLASLVGFLWFQISFLIGLLAFWLEETWVLRVMFLTMSQFLSGALIPLELYPEFIKKALMFTPFPYLTYVPASVFMESYQASYGLAIAMIFLWITIISLAARFVWQRGLNLYTAAGM